MKNCTEFWLGLRGMIKLYEKTMKTVCTAHALTMVETDIIAFLKNNPQKDTAADIVELRMLSKGAVSKGVEALIQKELIRRYPDTEDRRRLHLQLTDRSELILTDIERAQTEFWNTVFEGFSEEELEIHERLKTHIFENVRNAEERRMRP
ncbi:MarR family transcriptional regulator [Mediterraneibacter glycyrrhizinilyticus]|mgnify:FL=1|uniref:MarR family winged helix-turn-helix transcriptional regulator n=1 Tax=Mediterraneibacter glycyrrhizinilyticus TaxID=342942 RepID=UPI0019614705|nr:MarR family transcriptional regulator [Mediterraneibacter glycyrrhizinilyticus]MBM6750623.1 MarR family transcriptional regulator [Mediterraneibacter glycyrrhizinilyticus]